MKSVEIEGIEGFYLRDIKKELGPERYKEFGEWFQGQTGAIDNKGMIVYKHDYERFLLGMEPAFY